MEHWEKFLAAVGSALLIMGTLYRAVLKPNLKADLMEAVNKKIGEYHKAQEDIRAERGKLFKKEFDDIKEGQKTQHETLTEILDTMQQWNRDNARHDERIKNLEKKK